MNAVSPLLACGPSGPEFFLIIGGLFLAAIVAVSGAMANLVLTVVLLAKGQAHQAVLHGVLVLIYGLPMLLGRGELLERLGRGDPAGSLRGAGPLLLAGP